MLLQKMKAFAYLVFPNSILSVLPEGALKVKGEPMEHGIITSVTQGAMSGICHGYRHSCFVSLCFTFILPSVYSKFPWHPS
jgi:hypothetical protein